VPDLGERESEVGDGNEGSASEPFAERNAEPCVIDIRHRQDESSGPSFFCPVSTNVQIELRMVWYCS
jgi:hypothetical protein